MNTVILIACTAAGIAIYRAAIRPILRAIGVI